LLLVLKAVCKALSPLRPEGGLLAQPFLRRPERIGLDRYPMFSAPHLASDEAGRLEYSHVARDPSEGHGQRPGEVGNACIAFPQRRQQSSASGIRECSKGTVEDLIFNHLV
jgi:hypothetical protein